MILMRSYPKLKAYTVGRCRIKGDHVTKNMYWKEMERKLHLLDLGAKNNIARSLNKRGCEVTVYPAHTPAEEIISMLIRMASCFLMDLEIRRNVQRLLKKSKNCMNPDIPIFAICLGHQLMALATGADTHKLKYGHRGGNHPVKDLETGRVYISSQNHGYVVDTDTARSKDCSSGICECK